MRHTRVRPSGVKKVCVTTARLIEKAIARKLLLRTSLYDLGLQSQLRFIHCNYTPDATPHPLGLPRTLIDSVRCRRLRDHCLTRILRSQLPVQLWPYLVFSNIGFLSDHDLRISSCHMPSTTVDSTTHEHRVPNTFPRQSSSSHR
jgi:hypothetical protein